MAGVLCLTMLCLLLIAPVRCLCGWHVLLIDDCERPLRAYRYTAWMLWARRPRGTMVEWMRLDNEALETTETAHVVAATLSAAPGGGGPTGRRTRSCGDPTTDDPSTMMVDRPQRLASVPRLHPSLPMVAHHHGSLFVPLPATPLSTRVSGRTAISPTAEHGATVVDGRGGGAVSARLASADDVLAASFYTPSRMMTPPSTAAATPTNGSSHMLLRTMRTPRDNNDPLPSAREWNPDLHVVPVLPRGRAVG